MQENELIKASQNGDIKALEKLIKPYEGRIFNFLSKMCQQKEAAEDMLQETFLKVFHKIKEFRGESKFSTWVFQIATNHCLMLKRSTKQKNLETIDESKLAPNENDLPTWQMNPAARYEKAELKKILDVALTELPEIYRAAFILKDVEGFKAQEIAEMLKVSLPNVKARILRARLMLQKILKEKFAYEK